MGLTLQEVLLTALKKLDNASFNRFIEKLSAQNVREQYKNISKDDLTGKDPEQVAGLINLYYGYAYGAEVTLNVLEDIGQKKVREELQQDLREGHVVDQNRSYLINYIKEVQPVLEDLRSHYLLTEEQYKDLQVMRTGGDHFIDRYKEQLITEIREVHPVIYDLHRKSLLTREQFDHLLIISDTEEQMRRLYDIISDWDENDKEKVYLSLYEHNPGIIRDLKMCEDSSTVEKSGDHFIDRHKEQLITGIREVYWVIRHLHRINLLTREQRDDLLKISDTEDKMRRLYDIIDDWDDDDKQKVYLSLYKFNPGIFRDLKMCEDSSTLEKSGGHFIDRHKEQLITGKRNVHGVIRDLHRRDLLAREQRDDLLKISDTEDKIRRLYDIISDWDDDDDDKQKVYLSLYKYNPEIIRDLKKCEDSSTVEKSTSTLSTISDQQSDDVSKPFALMEIEKDLQSSSSEANKDTGEPQTSLEEVTADNIICKLCGKDQDEAEVVSSTVGSIYRLELKSPGLYRCQKTGIKFLVKGPVVIEFKLDSWSNHLKDIPDNSYEILGPLFNIQTSGEPDAVSAVYLPHFLCLKACSEGKALIKCAHFRDGNMTLETPTQIEPFYITLENPTFSCVGPLIPFRKKKTPIHGSVLIYFTILCQGDPDEEHRIHFYVLPNYRNTEQIQALDDENIKFGFHRIKKPEHTASVYTKVKYLVTGHPGVSANPPALMFQTQSYQFTEIQLQEKIAHIFLKLCEENSEDPVWTADLTQRDIKNFMHLQSRFTVNAVAGAGPLPEHFVDRHREALIQRTSNISPVLDNLLSERLLTQEQYDTLRGMTPHQEAMRQLYVYMTIWGHSDKDKLYQALKTYNKPLIRDLEDIVIL